jgi:ribonuclease Z
MFIEAPFLHEDAVNAAQKYHLTARQAGMLARQAGAKRMVLFHFSPKYKKAPDVLNQEAMHVFQGDS